MFTKFSPSIYVAFIAKTIMTIGNFVYPFLTLYLTQRLGLNAFSAGLIIMLSTGGCVAGSIIGGFAADAFDRKKTVAACLSLSGLCYVIVPLFTSPVLIIMLLCVALALLSASEPAFNALISNLTEENSQKSAFSFIYWGMNIGFAVGPLIAGFLFTNHTNLLFIGDGTATIAAAVLLYTWVKMPRHKFGLPCEPSGGTACGATEEGGAGAEIKNSFAAAIVSSPVVMLFCFLFISHSFIYSQTNFAVPLLVEEYFPNGPALYGILMAINGIAVFSLTPLIVPLFKKATSLTCVASGVGIYAVAFGMIMFSHAFPVLILAAAAWSCGEILCVPNAKAFIAESTQNRYRGRFCIFLDIAFETGFGAGPAAMGKLITMSGLSSVWPAISFISIFSSVSLFALKWIPCKPDRHRGVHEH